MFLAVSPMLSASRQIKTWVFWSLGDKVNTSISTMRIKTVIATLELLTQLFEHTGSDSMYLRATGNVRSTFKTALTSE